MNAKIDIKPAQVTLITTILQQILADTTVLYMKTRNAHWNVVGQRFPVAHAFFEEQYKALELAIDAIAERIRMLGKVPEASLAAYVERTRLKEAKSALASFEVWTTELLADYEEMIRNTRAELPKVEELGDLGTHDFLIGLIQDNEKTAWMLRASLS